MTKEIDISRVLIEGDTATIMGVKYKRVEEPKTPVEEAYKRWMDEYPKNNAPSWLGFQAGYDASQKDYKVGEYQPTPQEPEENEWKSVALRFGEKLSGYLSDGYYELSPNAWFRWAVFTYGKGQQVKEVVRENLKWFEENPEKSVEDYLKPQTPEQVADGLKEAFREAIKQGVVSSVDKPKDDFMDKMVAELKGQTLYDLIADWWDEIFMNNNEAAVTIESLVEDIEKWLPKEQSAAGSQNAYVECSVEGFNDAIKKIKSKLR